MATLLMIAVVGQAIAGGEQVVLEGRWKTEQSETICLVYEGDTIVGFDEPGSICPDGTQREQYIENAKLDSNGFQGVMYRCNATRLINECKQDPVWGPTGFTAPAPTSERISGTRRGEYFEDCKRTRKDDRRNFSLTRVGNCNLDGACASIEEMRAAIDPGRRERLAERLETLRLKLNGLRDQLECLICEGRKTRTQSLLGTLLSEINAMPAPKPDAEMPFGTEKGRCIGNDSQECAQVKAIYRIRTTLDELGGLLGCSAPTQTPSPTSTPSLCPNGTPSGPMFDFLKKEGEKTALLKKKFYENIDALKSNPHFACTTNLIEIKRKNCERTNEPASCIDFCKAFSDWQIGLANALDQFERTRAITMGNDCIGIFHVSAK